ncbi:MAG: di-trans,poly-cis-decaprenylcistransferase [Hydrogenobacter thermophilus]|uniref:polyprenyl diphosphate synthase n=1 Tax=Hydrogenobacter thermophilus TaxID=940 RepID=UPI001C77F06F|nr:polyprenyl diphosphate synthase [Hydrogenobacter thermophilus]QWK19292.1 MAG: di-trans,poly-cis-decaprenylcistransferase [Hydrogenobacter thermophilus]
MTSLKIPTHLAVIMDGNGRWAKERGLSRIHGHYQGVKRAEELVDACIELGIKYLTLFTFSTENWKRPEEEVKALFMLFESYLKEKKDELISRNIRLKFIGRRDRLPKELVMLMEQVEEDSKECNGITVCMALDYGGRNDIVRAINKVLKAGLKSVDETTFSSFLDLDGIPDPDLLIRTAGEMRISNFLLWNLAYSELYFTDTYWPDFDKTELLKAIENYSRRVRKFGAVL